MATRKIAVLTSGGDAPGMNAAIRAVVRTGISKGWEIFGVRNGYAGLVAGQIEPLGARAVGGILQQGGTFLGSARLLHFREEETRAKGIANLRERGIDGLIVIGGNGSQTGALALSRMGLEVMGRNCGYLALMAGIAGGAESVVIPEAEIEPEVIARDIQNAHDRGKAHALVIVAEGAKNNAVSLAEHFAKHRQLLGFDLRVTTLGHVQRGGVPGAFDRLLATRLAAAAVEHLAAGEHGRLMGLLRGEVVATPLAEIVGATKPLDVSLLKLQKVLAQ